MKKELSAEVAAGAIEGYIVFPPDIVEKGTATYFGKKVSNIRTLERIENALNETVVAQRLAMQGLDYGKVTEMLKRVNIETVQVLKGGEKASEFEQDVHHELHLHHDPLHDDPPLGDGGSAEHHRGEEQPGRRSASLVAQAVRSHGGEDRRGRRGRGSPSTRSGGSSASGYPPTR